MHRSRQRSAAAVPHTVMARLVRAIYSSTCAATDGPDKPGHDDGETLAAIKHLILWDFMAVSEMCASRRHKAGHDTVDMTLPPPGCFSTYTDWLARGTAGSAPSRLSLMQS